MHNRTPLRGGKTRNRPATPSRVSAELHGQERRARPPARAALLGCGDLRHERAGHRGPEAFALSLAVALPQGRAGGGQGKQSPHLAEEEAEPQGGPMSRTQRVATPDCTQLHALPPGRPASLVFLSEQGDLGPNTSLGRVSGVSLPQEAPPSFLLRGGRKAVWKPHISHLCPRQCLAQSLAHRVPGERPSWDSPAVG